MQSFKRLLIVIVALALAAGVVFFTLENRTATQLVFFGWQTPELPMALYVLSVFVLGLILGPLLSWWPHQRLRMRYNKQIKQLKVCEQRIAELQKAAAEQDVPVSGAAELPNVS
ncbi:MAG: LapA family protein [Pseudomonas sp.]|jgi:uncharacterized integral membrane protein|nr:LapA family protein [Pseudomonas sp.]MDD2222623.1 LapA family protein [Pseudomonas sp.]MDY0413733.1 LapA family protein [Pseudomonas sp.]NLO53390.1 LapA family protein [Gammaproteobacteria bacterium]